VSEADEELFTPDSGQDVFAYTGGLSEEQRWGWLADRIAHGEGGGEVGVEKGVAIGCSVRRRLPRVDAVGEVS